MKKINLIFFSLFACVATANAQIEGDVSDDGFGQKPTTKTTTSGRSLGKTIGITTKHYNYELSVGLRIAGGMSSMNEGDDLKIYDKSGMSFGGGLAANLRFGDKDARGRNLDGQGLFGVGLELNYKQHTVKTLANKDLKLGYFEVPIMLQFYPGYNTKQLKNLYVEVGPTIAGTLSKSPDMLKYNYAQYNTGDLKGFDVKATIGVGYRFNKMTANDGFYANVRYYLGTSKLAGNFPGKINSVELSVGYLFKCIGTKK